MTVMMLMTKICIIQKPADHTTFKWTPPLLFYDLGQRTNMCTRIFQTQSELKQNVVENKIEREKFWIEPHVGLIKTKSHISGVHFEDEFITLR